MKKHFLTVVITFLTTLCVFAEPYSYPVGERLTYRIVWKMLPVGKTVILCEQVPDRKQNDIRIRVEAKSNRLVSALYPVDNLISSYINPNTGLPYRVEKKTSEGNHVCDDTLQLNHSTGVANWHSRSASISTNYPIHYDTLDVAAFLYAIRSEPFAIGESKTFHIAADAYLQGLTIIAEEQKKLKTVLSNKKILCTRFSVQPERSDFFVRKVPSDIWVTNDDRRIMVKMKTKTPLGKVHIVLNNIETIGSEAVSKTTTKERTNT